MKTSNRAFFVMMAYIGILLCVIFGLNQVAKAQVVVTPAPVTCSTVCDRITGLCTTICR